MITIRTEGPTWILIVDGIRRAHGALFDMLALAAAWREA